MTQRIECNICHKTFSSKPNLKLHLQTICQRDENLKIVCNFCQSEFSRQSNLSKHLKICPKKGEYSEKQQALQLTKDLEEAKAKILSLSQDYEAQIKKVQDEFNLYRQNMSKMYKSVTEQNTELKQRIENLKGQNKILQQNKSDEKSKNITINNINNNNTINNLYIQNLEPITDELIRETGRKVGMMDLKDGAPGIMRKFQPVLKNRIICTDASRNSLVYNYNGKLKRDTEGRLITDKIISSTHENYKLYKDDVEAYYKNLDTSNMTDEERARIDIQFDNYKEYSKAVRLNTEFTKKKISKRIAKTIASFARSKVQIESEHPGNTTKPVLGQLESDVQEDAPVLVEQISEPVAVPAPVVPKQNGRLNKVAATKQTLINGRIFEQHLDEHGGVIRQIRIRSSGLPYLTDEETDPSSREQTSESESETEHVLQIRPVVDPKDRWNFDLLEQNLQ